MYLALLQAFMLACGEVRACGLVLLSCVCLVGMLPASLVSVLPACGMLSLPAGCYAGWRSLPSCGRSGQEQGGGHLVAVGLQELGLG